MKKVKKQIGKGCSMVSSYNVPNCVPNVNMSQYKCPCSYLPLDGYRHNVYPLSHNPPKLNNMIGAKKSKSKNSKSKSKYNKSIRVKSITTKSKPIRKKTLKVRL